jgi:hypothetical protein
MVSQNFYDQWQSTLPAPAAPSLSTTTGGSDPATTYYVKVTLLDSNGESLASTESSLDVPAGDQLVVASPASAGDATTYNVYAGTTSGQDGLQNSTPILPRHRLHPPQRRPRRRPGRPGERCRRRQPHPDDSAEKPPQPAVRPAFSIAPAGVKSRRWGVFQQNPQTTVYPGGSQAPRITQSFFDWRDRMVASKSGIILNTDGTENLSAEAGGTNRRIEFSVYDNLGEVTEQDTLKRRPR